MARIILFTLFSLAAIVCFYAATSVAPDLTFPDNSREWFATHLLIVGFILKLNAFLFAIALK